MRATLCDRLQKRVPNESPAVAAPSGDQQVEESDERRTITIDSRSTPVASTMDQITDRLLATALVLIGWSNWLLCESNRSRGALICGIDRTAQSTRRIRVYFVNEDGGEYKPLPTSYANTWRTTSASVNGCPQFDCLATIRSTPRLAVGQPRFRSPVRFLLRWSSHRAC